MPKSWIAAATAVPILAAWLTYCGSLDGAFLFDDVPSIVENAPLQQGDFWGAAFGSKHSPVSNRPIVCLSFALNFAIDGLVSRGYHAVNVLLHGLNAGLVFAVVRRTLQTPNGAGAFDPRGGLLIAAAAALLWGVHPLASEAVVYVTQRTTLLMSFFFLSAVYCVLRSSISPRRRVWDAAVVICLMLGMASKEEFVAAPILVALFERAFLLPNRYEWRRRLPFYGACAASWLVLIGCVAVGPENPTVGYGRSPSASAWEWLLTEAPVVVRYLRLSFLPTPLIGAYDWPIVRTLGPAVVPGLVVVGLIAATAVMWLRRPCWGWLGAMFFLLLAPTSSVLPIVTEIIAERRMYLPMLVVVVPAVVGLWQGIGFLAAAANLGRSFREAAFAGVVLIAAVCGSFFAARHASVFADEATFWADVYAKNELTNKSFMSGKILAAYGKVLAERGRLDEAHELFRRAIECDPTTNEAWSNYAASLVDKGRPDEAEPIYRRVLADNPKFSDALGNLAKLLIDRYLADPPEKRRGADDPRLQEAEALTRRAIALQPLRSNYYNALGMARYYAGDRAEAERAFRAAAALPNADGNAARNLAAILEEQGRFMEAAAVWQALIRAAPADAAARLRLADDYRKLGDAVAADAVLRELLQLDPQNAAARAALSESTSGSGR